MENPNNECIPLNDLDQDLRSGDLALKSRVGSFQHSQYLLLSISPKFQFTSLEISSGKWNSNFPNFLQGTVYTVYQNLFFYWELLFQFTMVE